MIIARRETLMKARPSEKLIPHPEMIFAVRVMIHPHHFSAQKPQSYDKLQIIFA